MSKRHSTVCMPSPLKKINNKHWKSRQVQTKDLKMRLTVLGIEFHLTQQKFDIWINVALPSRHPWWQHKLKSSLRQIWRLDSDVKLVLDLWWILAIWLDLTWRKLDFWTRPKFVYVKPPTNFGEWWYKMFLYFIYIFEVPRKTCIISKHSDFNIWYV